jgi:signal transduction histidine kinase
MNKELLRQMPLFAGLADDDLDRLYHMAESVALAQGEILVAEGEPGDALYVTLAGTFDVSKRTGEREVVIATCGPGDVIGEISLLESIPRTATVRATQDARLLKVSRATFLSLLERNPAAALGVLTTMTTRLRNTETLLHQSEKMAALGTFSAGLAHELNNPAAAVKRGAGRLRAALVDLQQLAGELGALSADGQTAELVRAIQRELPARSAAPAKLDPMARSDHEEEVGAWLDEQGIDEAWELAPAVVGLGWGAENLAEMTQNFSAAQRQVFLRWLGAGAAVYSLLGELAEGAERIAEIVRAVKSYTYLGQTSVQLVDVHEGLDNTLVILRHKLRGQVTVVKEYAPDLPRIEAYAGELNQVWTNLIDNAIDALEGPDGDNDGKDSGGSSRGEIRIRTAADADTVFVEISDNGPGIPPQIQGRIFDAFFTTKPVGVGTGLGLHITHSIVVQQHQGRIAVTSTPAWTTFRVTLPVRLAR